MKKLSFLPRLALVLALLLPVWFLVASLGAKFGLWSKMFGFGTMTAGWGPIMAAIVAVLAVIALIVSLVVKPRQGWLSALIALAIPLAIFAGFNALRQQAGSVPFIYDVTTNPADAPNYSAAMMMRRGEADANELIPFGTPLGQLEKWSKMDAVSDKSAGDLIAESYPELETLIVPYQPDIVLQAIEGAMEVRGMGNIAVDEDKGIVEGTDEIFWYGFQDDVVARVCKVADGSSVDFRSTSRIGLSDLGVNARRISDLSMAVEDRLAGRSASDE